MSYRSNREGSAWPFILVFAVIIFLVGLIIFFTSTARVGPNEVGVVESGSSIDPNQTVFQPGWHSIMPFRDGVTTVMTTQQNHVFSEVQATTGNQQLIYFDGQVSFHVDAKRAPELVIQGGADAVIQRSLWPAFQDYLRAIAPSYTTYGDVQQHQEEIRTALRTRLEGKTDQFGLSVDEIYLTKIRPSTEYQAASDAAAAAVQRKVQAQNEAAAQVAKAQGDHDAANLRNSTLTPEQLQYMALQNQAAMIAKWDGKLPQVSSGSNPFLNLTVGPQK